MYKKFNWVLSICLSVLILSGCSKVIKDDYISESDFLMDTVININIYDIKDDEILSRIYGRLYEIENRMSKTMKVSDVSKVNAYAGSRIAKVNPDTFKLLESAKLYSQMTGGIFDPTIGPLSNLWDINSSSEDRSWIPSKDSIERAKAKVDYEKLSLGEENQVFLEESGMELDLGAIAKGYAADEARRVALKNGSKSAILDLGGNVYALGSKPNGDPWKIGIKDPDSDLGDYLGLVSIRDKSVVTSGDYERFFELESTRYHHIIDPRTGYPANNDLRGVTIISDSSMEGDVFSTTAFIMGLEAGYDLIEKTPGLEGIFISKENKIYLTSGARPIFKLKDGIEGYNIAN